MNKKILFSLLFVSAIGLLYLKLYYKDSQDIVREKHATFIKNHPYSKIKRLSKKERKDQGLPPNAFFEQEYLNEINPFTGVTNKQNVFAVQKELKELRESQRVPGDGNSNAWQERGPDNVGGRTRAIIFDPNDTTQETVFAGGVSGGLWKNTNISNASSTWTQVDIPENLSISCIAIDPNNSMIWYVGTGESYVNGDVNGTGVYRSTDGGSTWTKVFGGVDGETLFEANAKMSINSPSNIAGDYDAVVSTSFGENLNPPVTGDLVLVNDDVGNTDDGCTSFTNSSDISTNIAVIRRGDCPFVDKVRNAQNSGAIAVVMINNVSGLPINQGGDDPNITIPTVMISNTDGDIITNELANGNVNITLSSARNGGSSNLLVSSGVQHVNDIVVRDNNGVSEVYVAAADALYGGASPTTLFGINERGVYKSTDGTSFTKLAIPRNTNGNEHEPNDIEIGADNSVYIATTSDVFGEGGGVIFQSTNSDATTFVRKHEVTDGLRTEIACSNSDASTLYVLAQLQTAGSPVGVYKTTNNFNTVTTLALPDDVDNGIPANDFTRGQAFYDLLLSIDPNNDNTIFLGGIDLFKSTNGGNTYTQISKWSNNNNLAVLQVPLVHADQHGIAFSGSSSSRMLFSNDGGVYYSNDGGTTINSRNKGYNTLQFYTVGVAPTSALPGDNYLAGAQDNGTQLFENVGAGINSSVETQGGDGAYSFFDQDGTDQYYIANFVYNRSIRLYNVATNSIRQINSENISSGDFINQEELDSNLDILYSNYSGADFFRIRRYKNIKSGVIEKTNLDNSLMDAAPSAMKVSPYTTTSTKLFAGLKNGRILKIDNADTTPSWTEITGTDFFGTVSDIEFGTSEDEIFVTMHNYGVENIWYTNNGGTTWSAKEGDLPDIPVKAILQNPLRTNEVIVGTELGVWATTNFNDANPNWVQSNNGMKNVKVLDLDLRDDNTVFAATYGRGVFSGEFTDEVASINEVLNGAKSFTIYPTISDGNFTVFGKDDLGKASLSIFDLSGKQVYVSKLDFKNKKRQSISLNLNAGMYIINLVDQNNRKSTRKIIIE